jgi:hypothetical protein
MHSISIAVFLPTRNYFFFLIIKQVELTQKIIACQIQKFPVKKKKETETGSKKTP